MRMKLKNKNAKNRRLFKFKRIEFNSKNLFIFLIAFFFISFVIGIVFFLLLNTVDKNQIVDNNYLYLNDNTNYVSLFRDNLLENTFNTFLIWILGLSVVGILIVVIIYFFNAFSLGFVTASFIYKYKIKGLLGIFCYLFPSKLLSLVVIFFLSFFAIKISYKIITICFLKTDINIKNDMNRYFKILFFFFVLMILISLFEVFIDPFFIKMFS